ncbi:MAG: hypothetical protein N2647_06065, partial [Thermodesulfovibrio sp.]|nr:hypothetical protein [Thermodesulfovibrio sp.]
MFVSFRILICLISLSLFLSFEISSASNEAFQKLKEDILSYFPVISGSVKKSEADFLILDKGLKDGIKKGQRVILFEETVPLIHPVTKQVIGKSEKIIGSAEIISVENNFSRAIILEGDLKTKSNQILFKIPKSKIKILYAQTNTEWAVGEA